MDICEEAEKGYTNIDGVMREGLARAQATIANVWNVIGGEPDNDEDPEVRELEDAVRVSLEYERDKVEDLKEEIAAREAVIADLERGAEKLTTLLKQIQRLTEKFT
jgi:hypothetical protein